MNGENHPEYAYALNNIAVALQEINNHESALEFLFKCENIQR